MKKKITFTFLMLAASVMLLFSAGKSSVQYLKEARAAKKAGNYYEAVLKLVDAILANPKNRQAQDMLIQVYHMTVSEIEKKIVSSGTDFSNYCEIVDTQYKGFLNMKDSFEKLQGIAYYGNDRPFDFDINALEQQFKKSFEIIARELYREAEQLSRSSNKDILRQAAEKFQEIEKYVINYKDARQRYEETRKSAVKRIVLIFQDENTAFFQEKEYFENAFFGQESLSPAGSFYEVVRESELNKAGIDGVCRVTFFELNYTPVSTKYRMYPCRQNSSTTKELEAYITEAIITTGLSASVRVEISKTGSHGAAEKNVFSENVSFKDSEFRFEGDWGALSNTLKKQVKKGKTEPPTESELYRQLLLKCFANINMVIKSSFE